MPTYKITDPSTGKTASITGDSMPSPDDIEEIFNNPALQSSGTAPQQQGFLSKAMQGVGKVLNYPSRLLGKLDNSDYLAQPAVKAIQNAQTGSQINPVPPQGMNAPGGYIPSVQASQGITEDLGRTVSDPLTYAGIIGKIPWLAGVLSKAAAAPEVMTTTIASSATGIPSKALTMASTAAGRATLNQAVKGAGTFGSDLNTAIDKYSNSIPEKSVINEAIPKMGNVSVQPAIDALEKARPANPTGQLPPQAQLVDNKITQYQNFLKGNPPDGQFFRANYPASDVLQMRKMLDEPIDYENGVPAPKELQGALFQARTALKDALIDAADKTGNPQYSTAMKSYSDKLDLLGSIKRIALGNGPDISQEARATRFGQTVGNESNAGNQVKKIALQRFDDMAGTDFTKRAEAENMASEFADQNNPLGTGDASFKPQGGWWGALRRVGGPMSAGAFIGSKVAGEPGAIVGSGIGAAIGLPTEALASPGIATKLAIPAARSIQNIPPYLLAASQASPILTAIAAAGHPALQGQQ